MSHAADVASGARVQGSHLVPGQSMAGKALGLEQPAMVIASPSNLPCGTLLKFWGLEIA